MSGISANDTALLKNWEVGFSGQSWFKRDKYDNVWQAYIVDGDRLISFVPIEDMVDGRVPTTLSFEEFKELFG